MAEENKTPENSTPEIDYKAEYEKMVAERDNLLNENKKQKDAIDKACSEAASYKKAIREKQTEEERKEAERAEREAARDAELEKYRTESRINGYKSKLLECGYDLETASAMAAELPEGIKEDFFAKQKAFNESQKKTIEAELLNKQPKLTSGGGFTGADANKIADNALRASFGLPPIK